MTIYFYKVWQPYGCFSNFSPHHIEIQGTYWSTVEHYYQAQKFVGSADAMIIPLIRAAKTPEEAAALGRCSSRRLRADWDLVKIPVMQTAVWQKFMTHPDIKEILLSTGDEVLVENSPTDYFWGCGAEQTGQNHLGKILMGVREDIRKLQELTVFSCECQENKG
ncbi:NADAR family protein [Anabaena sp. 4-3]|uniref:NADAR family protein n=1 Tax=Anabaena sp. 4-3 TaxID=1811979 RepID=UPI0008338C10|nr:NADAR domain-containing protein [Anabaena sp. 4-3]